MNSTLDKYLKSTPVIASIKDEAGLKRLLACECKIVFVLFGTILNIGDMVKQLKDRGKIVFVDVDLIDGFASKDIVTDYLRKHTQADGVLSSKANMIKAAKAQGFYTVHRLFIIDSFSFHNIDKQLKVSQPDCVQILPGAMPKVIKWIAEIVRTPIIVGGLVCEEDDVITALEAGAASTSSTNPELWTMTPIS